MKRILVFATTTGYQTRAFGEAAETLGIELVFATDRCDQIDDPWRDGAIAIRFHEEARSIDAVVAAARQNPVDGIVALGDRPTVIAAGVAEQLGIALHSAAAARIARDKLRTRERLRDAGLPVPWFTLFPMDEFVPAIAPRIAAFPCVLKPLALAGSRGVMRADDAASFKTAWARLRGLLSSPDVRVERNPALGFVLVEGFIPGREFAVEALMHQGALHVLTIFDKPDPLDGPFFEETIYVTPPNASAATQKGIVAAVERAAKAIGLSHGPLHAECRLNEAGVFVLEVGARPIGGLCARALRFEPCTPGTMRSEPILLEQLLLRHALGDTPYNWRRESAASGVMMIPIPQRGVLRSVEGIDEAAAVDGITDVRITAKVDQLLVPLPEGASYLGFIFARGASSAAVEHALRAAHACLRFGIDAELTILGPSHMNYNHTHG